MNPNIKCHGVMHATSAAPEPFQQLVTRADRLLSPGWMAENDIALPALPPPGDTGGPAA